MKPGGDEHDEVNDFALRLSATLKRLSSSNVFFIMQQAYEEDPLSPEWEWSDWSKLLDDVQKEAFRRKR